MIRPEPFGMILDAGSDRHVIDGDRFEQSCRAVNTAEAFRRFTRVPERDLFQMEYRSLEQAKLKKP